MIPKTELSASQARSRFRSTLGARTSSAKRKSETAPNAALSAASESGVSGPLGGKRILDATGWSPKPTCAMARAMCAASGALTSSRTVSTGTHDRIRASRGKKMGSVDALLRSRLRDIPDFPKPGIVFKDLTPLLADADAWKKVCDELAAPFKGKKIGRVCGIESR